MAAVDHPVRASSSGPFQLRIQVVVPFKVRWSPSSDPFQGAVAPFRGSLSRGTLEGAVAPFRWSLSRGTLEGAVVRFEWGYLSRHGSRSLSSGGPYQGAVHGPLRVGVPVKARFMLAPAHWGNPDGSTCSASLGMRVQCFPADSTALTGTEKPGQEDQGLYDVTRGNAAAWFLLASAL